ncbi:MAG: OmpA family protein [Candidatus Omnitrophica bacterium]|nr:OmpA family protein [Candidatus Omnitrophota bacterium]
MKKIMILLLASSVLLSGCALNFYKKSPKDKEKIEKLSGEVDRLSKLREDENKQFEEIKRDLEGRLKGKKVGLELEDRGLVITLADNILFDSGKAEIKDDAKPVLNKICKVIKSKAADKNIGVEGHTDNVPIKHSGWKSNRELSTARANNVYHYLIDVGKLIPAKLTTMGYGEFKPVVSNDTEDGRAKNRRVEIVILPEFSRKKSGAELKEKGPWIK